MIRYFFKLAFRNIRKHKVNTLISIFGLTVGLASFILIATYIKHELSFNKYNENYEQIFPLNIDFHVGDEIVTGSHTSYPLLEKLLDDFPEIINGVRLRRAYIQVTSDSADFFENRGYYADNSLFEIFTFDFLKGNKKNALRNPYTVVLTKSYAEKYYGKENPVGKSLLIDKNFSVKVTAVIDDMPVNTDFQYDFFISLSTFINNSTDQNFSQDWTSNMFRYFFLLDKNCEYKKLNEKISGILDPYSDNVERDLHFSPLSDYHLKSEDNNLLKLIVIFGIVAIFILIIACINFINLSIANAANRVKETSIRRIVGSKKSTLILQQMGESVLLSFISFDLAYLIAERLLPQFNLILQTEIPSKVILNLPFVASMFAIALLLGLVSGIFPAINISRVQPLQAISGRETKIGKPGLAKKGLVIFQYAVSIVLILASIVLSQQFDFIKNKDLGFDGEHIITSYVHKVDDASNPELKVFRDEMLTIAGVQNITLTNVLPFVSSGNAIIRKDNALKEEEILVDYIYSDISFLETFNIDLVSKKEFSINNNAQEIGFCYINETAVSKMNFDNPLGETIIVGDNKYEVVGVCADYHVQALQNAIQPQVIVINNTNDMSTYNNYRWMSIECNKDNVEDLLELARAKLKEHIPDVPYSFFSFGNVEFRAEALNKVQGVEKLFSFFTIIALLIACMGIFGLVALNVKNKTKEIGIRKTLGSSVYLIYKLIAREYLLLAFLGNILAWFPAWYFSNKILQDFAYRIDISLWVFVVGFISSILLTILTIAFHTIKAARTNPVEALRYE